MFFLTKRSFNIKLIPEVSDNIYNSFQVQVYTMKWYKILSLSAILILIFAVTDNCKQVTGGLDDQNPLLIVNIETTDPTIVINDTTKVYLIYYTDNNWTNPWLMHGSATNTIFNPTVGTFSTYIAAFYDANGNGVVDTGEPCTGFENSSHSGIITPGTPDPLTPLGFIPLEWRMVTINLDSTGSYIY